MPNPIILKQILKPVFDPIKDYRNRIIANGGTISDASLKAHDEFIKGCKSDGIWDSLLDVGSFAGDNLNSALIKLKFLSSLQSSLTNFNFLASDYSELSGINGGNNKRFDTGFKEDLLFSSDAHLSFYSLSDVPGNMEREIGTWRIDGIQIIIKWSDGNSYFRCFNDETKLESKQNLNPTSGFYFASRKNNNATLSRNSVVYAMANSIFQMAGRDATIAVGGAANTYTSKRFSFYSIGLALDAGQSQAFYQRVQTLQQSLNRAI